VTAAARQGTIPILVFDAGEAGDIAERTEGLGALARALETRKLIFLLRRGGLRPRGSDQHLPIINLAREYHGLVAARAFLPKQLYLLAQARRLLGQETHHRMQVTVTSPFQLLRELFTVKGSGTLIKRGGALVHRAGFGEVDVARLRTLLTSSFGRPPVDHIFERDISRIYLEESYRGAAFVRETPLGAYLSKFAVEREAQGEGLGRDLWQDVTSDYPQLYWRARPKNPIVPWYLEQCDGMQRTEDWLVFWKGLPPDRIAAALSYALAQPIDIP
jgi:acetylglutamate kinase